MPEATYRPELCIERSFKYIDNRIAETVGQALAPGGKYPPPECIKITSLSIKQNQTDLIRCVYTAEVRKQITVEM
jgi:hypothetical protein